MDIVLKDLKVDVPGANRTLFNLKNFNMNSGDHLLIKGESGKGKTSFLHLIAGLYLPKNGQITINNIQIDSLSDEERCRFRRAHIGLIFQRLNLLDHLSSRENVELARQKSKEGMDIDEVFDLIGLKDKMHTRASVLSLGEQQRVAIARVLVQNPDIILADEPTSSLDEKNTELVMNLLLRNSQNKTLILVSHDNRVEKYFNKSIDFTKLILNETI